MASCNPIVIHQMNNLPVSYLRGLEVFLYRVGFLPGVPSGYIEKIIYPGIFTSNKCKKAHIPHHSKDLTGYKNHRAEDLGSWKQED